MSRTALAFMSYVNLDDQHEQGRLTRFRECLSGEVRMQTGEPFDIFQDRKDIAWGQQWQKRIDESLDAVTFLIPIITPGFFKSEACREELERFLKREEELGRGDLILPVYYVNCPVLQDKVKRENDRLAQVIAARQYADWRGLRFEDFTSSSVRKALAKMAEQIVAALERSQVEEASRQQPEKNISTPAGSNTFASTGKGEQSIVQGNNAIGTQINNYYAPPQPESKPQPASAQLKRRIRIYELAKEFGLKSKDLADRLIAMGYPVKSVSSSVDNEMAADIRQKVLSKTAAEIKTESLTLVVDQHHQGDYATITDALGAAEPGTRILVRPGLYKEGIVIDKPVELIGDGERDDIILEASNQHTISFQADMARVANLTLRQTGNGNYCAVHAVQGRFDLEDCDISCQGFACVSIHRCENVHLLRNRIHDGKGFGVYICDHSQGTLKDNEITDNMKAGVLIRAGSNSILYRNRIYNGKANGIFICYCSQGTIEENEIFANAHAGVEITDQSDPILRRNFIFDGKGFGICIDHGLGTLEDNEISANLEAGVLIAFNSSPVLRCNRIYNGKEQGVFVCLLSEPTIENNDIFANAKTGVSISAGSHSLLRHNRIAQNGGYGIEVYECGGGIFEENSLRNNTEGAWDIAPDCEANVQRRGNKE